MWCLLLLAIVSCGMAQPVWGPYEVSSEEAGYHIRAIECVNHGDTIRVFRSSLNISQGLSDVNMVSFALGNSQILGSPIHFGLNITWLWRVESAYADAAGRWIVAVSGGETYIHPNRPWYHDFWFDGNVGTSLFSGSNTTSDSLYIHQDYWPYLGCSGQEYLSSVDISRNGNGQFTVTAIVNSCFEIWPGGPSEPWYFLRKFLTNSDGDTLLAQSDFPNLPAPLYGPTSAQHVRLSDGSITVITSAESSAENGVTVLTEDDSASSNLLSCALSDPFQTEFAETRGGNLLLWSGANLFGVQINGECEVLTTVNNWHHTSSIAFHTDFGFAALQATPGALLLARIDTAGNEVQPPGVLYETDGPPFIVDADVTITDDGKVVAVWSEYTDWTEGPRQLKIASTEWTTFLDTPEHSAPTIPRELSLSSYPNPFNSTVTIQYELPTAGDVTLMAFDLHGRRVATLTDEFASAGSKKLHWSPENLASGVYFITLHAPFAQTTHKILYLK